MAKCRVVVAASAILIAASGAALAGTDAVVAGAAVAKKKCSSCHRIGPEDGGKNAKPLAFADFVARTPGEKLSEAVETAVKKTHTGFTRLDKAELEAIAAFIESLRAEPPR